MRAIIGEKQKDLNMCTHTHIHMVKTISIMEDAYNILLKKKRSGESFSQVIRRFASVKRDIMQFAGAWSTISDAEKIKGEIASLRKKSTKELIEKYDLPRF